MNIENSEIQKNKIRISSLEELKKELNIDNTWNLEEFNTPIILTKEELAKFREEISKTPEWERLEKIKNFIQEKAQISIETEKELKDLIWDWNINWASETSEKNIKKSVDEEINESKWMWKIEIIRDILDKIWNIFDKIWNIFDKIALSFSRLIWKISPSMAKFFGIKNPASEIASKIKEKAENETEKKAQETITQTKPNYSIYWKIYFKLFSSKNELKETKWVDYNLEEDIWNDLISHNNLFLNLRYNELKNSSTNEKLYDELIKLNPKYKEKPKDIIKKHIDIVIKNIVWWDIEYTSWFFFKDTKKEKLTKWSEFIKKMYEAKWKNIVSENPSIKEIFESLNHLKDFDIFIDNSLDLEEILKSVSWKLDTFLSWLENDIANISEHDFSSLKNKLPKWALEDMTNFKEISIAILWSHKSRTLENNFAFAEKNNHDWITDSKNKQLIEQFIWNENEWLIKFWNEIYQNVFVSWKPISWFDSVKKSDLTLKDIYRLYLITWWESNIDKLNTIQKMNLTTFLLVWFSSPEWLWKKLWEISKLENSNIKISPDVEDMIIRMWKIALDNAESTLKVTAKFSWWFIKENPALRTWLIIILLKFPFVTKRQSVYDMLFRRN